LEFTPDRAIGSSTSISVRYAAFVPLRAGYSWGSTAAIAVRRVPGDGGSLEESSPHGSEHGIVSQSRCGEVNLGWTAHASGRRRTSGRASDEICPSTKRQLRQWFSRPAKARRPGRGQRTRLPNHWLMALTSDLCIRPAVFEQHPSHRRFSTGAPGHKMTVI
jgi:hypothetical protein